MYVINQFEINKSMHLERALYIYSTIPVHYCFVYILERKNYPFNYLEDSGTKGSCCVLKRTKYLFLFYPQSILFLVLIVTNIL